MPISDFLDLMPDTVTYEAPATYDEYGKVATYATAVSCRARVSTKHQRVAAKNGQDVISSIQVWLNSTTAINENGRLTLPDGSTPLIVSWDLVRDENGAHHTKVYLR